MLRPRPRSPARRRSDPVQIRGHGVERSGRRQPRHPEGIAMNEPLTRTMSSQLTLRLRERILAGTYAPGAALLQDSIAAEFGVSKIPVREALVQLQGEGLV